MEIQRKTNVITLNHLQRCLVIHSKIVSPQIVLCCIYKILKLTCYMFNGVKFSKFLLRLLIVVESAHDYLVKSQKESQRFLKLT